jgi:chitinase
MDHDLNGYIIWELSGDLMDDLSTPLLDAANAKLVNPSLDCSTMSDADAMMGKNANTSENEGPSLYYPLFDGDNSCVNDGNQPSYYTSSDLFEKIEVGIFVNTCPHAMTVV